ncbi:MAG: hypothetical protein IPI16_15245 [Comamonadaceae bacterium]|nr:hypothetical protein [Comamonadaceae bacterium]
MPRERFTPWPWRARLTVERDGEVTGLRVPRMDGRFLPGSPPRQPAGLVADKDLRAPAFKMQFGACVLEAGAYGDGSPFADDYFINVGAEQGDPAGRLSRRCLSTSNWQPVPTMRCSSSIEGRRQGIPNNEAFEPGFVTEFKLAMG